MADPARVRIEEVAIVVRVDQAAVTDVIVRPASAIDGVCNRSCIWTMRTSSWTSRSATPASARTGLGRPKIHPRRSSDRQRLARRSPRRGRI